MPGKNQLVEFPPVPCGKTPEEDGAALALFLSGRVADGNGLSSLRFFGENGKIQAEDHGEGRFAPGDEKILAEFLSSIISPGKRTAITFCHGHTACGKEKRGYAIGHDVVLPFGYEPIIQNNGKTAFLNDYLSGNER